MVRWQIGLALIVAGVGGFFEWVFLHNFLSALSGIEEPVFFILAVLGAPLIVLAGVVVTAIAAAQRLLKQGRAS